MESNSTNNYAISSDGIATALQDSASSLMAANNSYQEAVALIASANKVVQDPSSVGSALRTISLRLRGTSAKELSDAGEEVDGAATSKSKLRSKIRGLSGVDVLTATGEYKSTYQILLEISKVWKEMSDIDQAALLELIAGKTRSNTAAALLSNITDLENAYVDALNAEGSALKENEKYLDSIQGRIDLFNNAVQSLWSNLLDSNIIKGIVNIAKQFIEWLDDANNNIGFFKVALASIATISMIKGKMGPIGLLSTIIELAIAGSNKIKMFGETFNGFNSIISKLGQPIKDLAIEQTNLQASILATKYNEQQLTAVELTSKAAKLGLSESITTLNAAQMSQALRTTDITKAQRTAIIQTLGLTSETKALTAAEIQDALAKVGVSKGNTQAILSTLGLTTANKGLAASFGIVMKAAWPLLAIGAAILLITEVIAPAIDELIVTNDELAESIENTRSEIESLESDIKSLKDQIKDIQSRIAELASMPSLSFTQEEELENLKKQNAELERTLQLQEALKSQKEAQLKADVKKQVKDTWYNKSKGTKDYTIDKDGIISYDDFWSQGIGGKEAVNKAIEKYDVLNKKKIDLENLYQKALEEASVGNITKETYKELADASGTAIPTRYINSYYTSMLSKGQDEYLEDFKKNMVDNVSKTLEDISDGISLVLGDMSSYAEGLSYGNDKEINQFLDDLNYTTLKWNEAQGISATSSAIKAMFDDTQNIATKNIKTRLEEIATSDKYASTEEGNAQRIADATQVVQSALDNTSGTYSRLQTAMETMGLTANEVARYFTQLSQAPDSDTVQGITAQYKKGIDVLEQFKNEQKIIYEDLNGNKEEIGFDDLFKFNNVSEKWEAIDTQIAKVLQGADETAREEFGRLAEAVKNGGKDFDEAITSFNISGLLAVAKLTEETLTGLNQDIFKGVKDDISGLIDTFKELSTALEDTASAMDLLHSAEQQMNNSGQISVKTALALIESTDNWADVLTISEDKITLNKNAEEALIGSKLQLIEKNIDLALTEAQLQLAQLEGTITTLDLADADITTVSAQIAYRDAMNQASAATAGLGAAIDKLVSNLQSGKIFNLGNGVLNAFADAYDNALDVIEKVDTPSAEELRQRINDLKAQKQLVSKIGSAKDFKNYYDYDKTPGDKYNDGKSALDRIKEKYERQISNYSNQQTYLQNEVDRLQAENEAVSKSYYEDQIAIEEKKLKLYEKERTELLALLAKTKKGTDQWYEIADAIWDVEHAIQGSVKAMVDFRKEIVNLYKEAFDDIGAAYGNLDDLFDDQQNYIDKYNELLELQKKPVTESSIKEQLAIEQKQLQANEAELESLKKTRDDALANSEMQEGDEEWIEMEANIRDVEAAILDNQIAIENYKQAIIDLYTETFDKLNTMFSNKNDFFTSQQDYIEGYADYLETLGVDVPQELYEKLIEIEQDKREVNVNNLAAVRNHLADLETKGRKATDEEWVNAKNKAVELEKAILDNDKAMAGWQKTINEMDFTKFDDFIDRLGNLESEIKNIIGLLYKDKEDIALENGDWTDKGITTLGLYYQQMEIAKQKAKEYADKIDKLNKLYKDGEISEKDYYERLQTLKDGQWDAINNYEDMKDAIIDLNEARIDMIEEGYQKEIKAYSELIELKKEELDAERDLYNFKKDIEKQTKDITELERKLASLSSSTSAADIAEKRKLEAQLREANQSLKDAYYTHAKDAQGNALDRENKLYEKTRTDTIEELREKLKNVDLIIEETISKVLENASIALDTINGVSSEYGISISDNLIKPWQEATRNAENWKNNVGDYLEEIGGVMDPFKTRVENAFNISGQAAGSFATSVQNACNNIKIAIGSENEGFTNKLKENLKLPWENTSAEDGPITTFSDKVETALDDAIEYAKNSYDQMKNNLEAPWKNANLDTFSENVNKVLDQAVKDSEVKAAKISQNLKNATPSYTSGTSTSGGSGTNTSGNKPVPVSSADVAKLQEILNKLWNAKLKINGKYDSLTKTAVYNAQTTLKKMNLYVGSPDGLYGTNTRNAILKYINQEYKKYTTGATSSYALAHIDMLDDVKKKVPAAMYAKGTTGTKRDQWAITDEPQYGDELTLIPGKNGNLSFIRKGTGVVPAKLTERLIDFAMQNPADMSGSVIRPVISNVATNNYSQLSFDSLVHIDNCTEDSVDQVKKIVNDSLNKFAKQMNYRLKHT